MLLFVVQSNFGNNSSDLPKAADGRADLSDWEGASALQIIDLQGEWEFYRQQLLTKEELDAQANPPLVRLPHVWNDSSASPLGAATYRLRIQNAPVHQSLSLKLSKTPIFYKLFVDDQLVLENGYASSGSNRPSSVNTSKMAVFSVSNPDFDLILQVENTNYSIGGFWSTVQMGTEEQMRSLQTALVQKESILAGGLLMLALFYFCFYLVIRKDRLSLLFAAGCLLVLMRMTLQGESLGLSWIQDISFQTLLVLVHLTDGWAPVPFMFLIYFIFRNESRKWPFYLHFGCAVAYSVLAFILPANLLIQASTMMQVIAFSIIVYGCIVVTRALYNGREGAFPSIIGFAALLLFVIHDILFARSLIHSTFGELGSFGVTVFLVAQAFALAQRYFNYYREAERLSGELLVLNQQKDDFLANTSHELKTPLNGIISLAESLQSGVAGKLNERQAHNLELIASSGRRLHHLIDDLLIYSQIKHDAIDIFPAHFRLEGIVQPILDIHRHLAQEAGKEIVIVGDIPEQMTVLADENRVVQILHNLLGNAVKYTPEGKISVSARDTGAGWIEVAVSDTGIGIPEDKQQLIFEMFERVDHSLTKKDGGIGLGLPISKYLAERHGGAITVESREGLGSEFRFTLPAGQSSQVRAGAEGRNAPLQLPKSVRHDESLLANRQDRPGKGLVLVVDDDPVNLQAVLNFLTLDGYAMMAAMDGKKAWEIIQAQRERLALVIVDIMMPGLSGYELCRRIRKQWTELELPVLMMTAMHGQQALQAGFEAGTNDYLTKPFEAEEFRARVRTLLQIRHTMAKVKEAELAFLQAQIKPHFLYNTLNTISTFCMKDPRQARDLIGDFATYLRHSFDFHDFGEAISLEAELELVQAYLNIEQARFGRRLHIQYLIDASMEDMLIPQLTIQPLAENAVRHGVMRKSEGGTIVIEVRREEDHCRISVRDDGVGMREEQIAAILSEGPAANGERKGIGLKNIHHRLVQRYGSGLQLHAAGGTEVFFRIPIQSGSNRSAG